MPVHIKKPAKIKGAGNKMKIIEEFIGMVNSNTVEVSIARMKSPPGWEESPQTSAFNEYSLVLKGSLYVKTDEQEFIIREDEIVIAEKGKTV